MSKSVCADLEQDLKAKRKKENSLSGDLPLVPKLNRAVKMFERMPTKARFNWLVVDKYFSSVARLRLKNQDFSVIGNNCTAGGIYHKFGLPYTSPTVGLFFFPDDYLEFLENLQFYLDQPLSFVSKSRHPQNWIRERDYPIGVLGDSGVEVHFRHYKDSYEARVKWVRRCKRVNLDNLFIVYVSDSAEFLSRFEALPFKNKLVFTSQPIASECAVFVEDFAGIGFGESAQSRNYEKQINLVKWLNGEKNFRKER